MLCALYLCSSFFPVCFCLCGFSLCCKSSALPLHFCTFPVKLLCELCPMKHSTMMHFDYRFHSSCDTVTAVGNGVRLRAQWATRLIATAGMLIEQHGAI